MRLVHLCTFGLCLAAAASASASDGFTILDAISQAVQTHPGVGEAAANKRATEAELRQQQSTLLPQIRLEHRTGREKFNYKDSIVPPQGNNQWLTTHESTIVGRQLIFDGFASLNEIWRQAARVDAAAYRVRERTELLALDAAEAYIDVVRYSRLIAIAEENVAAHRRIFTNVQARFQGGRAGEGDLEQIRERVEAALASLAQYRDLYEQAKGTFRKAIGIEPYNLRVPGRLHGLPRTKDESLAVTLRHNPTIQAAEADKDAAKYAFHATAGAFVPTVSLEGRSLWAKNADQIFGRRTDYSAQVVASWDIFRGGQDTWKRAEQAERYQEQTMRHARLQRDAFESIDKAWSARTQTAERIAALIREIAADRKVIVAYQKEYELGQRSLIDLLNAQNQLFNALVSLESTKSVAIFADYQLLAAMGELLTYLKEPHPIDAEPLENKPFGLIPYPLPPILVKLPEPGSEPLNIGAAPAGAAPVRAYASAAPANSTASASPTVSTDDSGQFASRWPKKETATPFSWLEGLFVSRQGAVPAAPPASEQSGLPEQASSYAPEPRKLPAWASSVKLAN